MLQALLISSWNSYLKRNNEKSIFLLRDLEMVKQKRQVERRRGSGFQAYKEFGMEGNVGELGYIADIPTSKD